MQRTNIYLAERQTALLDRRAADEGVSRAELIRQLLDQALAGATADTIADQAAIEASFGVLAEAEAPPRGPGGREAHLAQMWESV
ncbi:MAG: ribbon-helix-helix domain-containing protein [Propionibacteriaceae bacterium]|jgi:hypothetical protein|nr:ribbon-helix-helix domain-containing protein [Propionibacteriaceae bacterium]